MTRGISPIRSIRPLHVAISALIILVTLTFIFSTLALLKVSSQADTATVEAAAAQNVAGAIQRERARSVRENCEQQNTRHNEAFKIVRALLRRPTVPPRQLTPEQKKAQRQATLVFVNALVPMRDCNALVKRQVHASKPSGN